MRTIGHMTELEPIVALPILVASLLGSGHCVGMCGGFVALYSHGAVHATGAGDRVHLLPHMMYNAGRLLTYLFLGTLAASIGASLDSFSGVGRLSSLIVGIMLITTGVAQLWIGHLMLSSRMAEIMGRKLRAVVLPVFRLPKVLRPLLIGLVTTLLPCGWLYTFVALALASADPATAAGIMVLFWLGTLPAMALTGILAQSVTGKLIRHVPRITALLVILSGFLSLMTHLDHTHHHEHHSHHSSEDPLLPSPSSGHNH